MPLHQLIKIKEYNGSQAVNARDLHIYLIADSETNVIGEQFNHWIRRMLEYGCFLIHEDYYIIEYDWTGAEIRQSDNQRVSKRDYILTLDCAKEICMIQRNEKGRIARRYFIEVEKKYKENQHPSYSIEDMMIMQLQSMKEQKEKIILLEHTQNQLQQDVFELKIKTTTRASYFTVVGYAALRGIKVNVTMAAQIGKESDKVCYEHNYPIDKVTDPRFGAVGSYPEEILESVFKKYFV